MTQTQVNARERTYTWESPAPSAASVGRAAGIELFERINAGTLPVPPIFQTVGMDALQVIEVGRVEVFLTPQEFHCSPLGTVHGGIISTLLDTAAACSLHTTLDKGFGYASLDLTVKFLRPVTAASGRLRAEGRVISKGRRTALAESQLFDGAGRLVAHATSTCFIFEVPPAG